jgi:hypothetical protein
VQDQTHLLTQAFGIYWAYSTVSRFNLYNFDDVYVGDIVQDTQAPSIVLTKPTSSTTLEVTISERVDVSTVQDPLNY